MDELHKKAEELLVEAKKVYSKVGNLVHESVFIINNEDDNVEVKLWGKPDKNRKIDDTVFNAYDFKVLEWKGGYDPQKRSKNNWIYWI